MKGRLTVVTLGVKDLDQSCDFYEQGLKWPVAMANENIVFFQLQGIILGLYPRHLLAEDAQVKDQGAGFSGVTLAINVESEDEVDALFSRAESSGAKAVKQPQKVFWGGYSGYFSDPDGHLWEVAHNPFWTLDKTGSVVIPPQGDGLN